MMLSIHPLSSLTMKSTFNWGIENIRETLFSYNRTVDRLGEHLLQLFVHSLFVQRTNKEKRPGYQPALRDPDPAYSKSATAPPLFSDFEYLSRQPASGGSTTFNPCRYSQTITFFLYIPLMSEELLNAPLQFCRAKLFRTKKSCGAVTVRNSACEEQAVLSHRAIGTFQNKSGYPLIRPIHGPHPSGAQTCVQTAFLSFCDSSHPWASPFGRLMPSKLLSCTFVTAQRKKKPL